MENILDQHPVDCSQQFPSCYPNCWPSSCYPLEEIWSVPRTRANIVTIQQYLGQRITNPRIISRANCRLSEPTLGQTRPGNHLANPPWLSPIEDRLISSCFLSSPDPLAAGKYQSWDHLRASIIVNANSVRATVIISAMLFKLSVNRASDGGINIYAIPSLGCK